MIHDNADGCQMRCACTDRGTTKAKAVSEWVYGGEWAWKDEKEARVSNRKTKGRNSIRRRESWERKQRT